MDHQSSQELIEAIKELTEAVTVIGNLLGEVSDIDSGIAISTRIENNLWVDNL